MRVLACMVLVAFLFFSGDVSQQSSQRDAKEDKMTFAENLCMAKGGIGIINSELYIDLKAVKNELILSGGQRWSGQDAPSPEVVIFFDGKILSRQSLPDTFDATKATLISFERDKVRFFDFGKMSGGYYRRQNPG